MQHNARTPADGGAECVGDAECFDGLACTLDICTPDEVCVNLEIPDCVPCTVKHDCSPLDLVFLMDTSGSMRDEASALCAAITLLEPEFDAIGIELNVRVLGITEVPPFGFGCLTDHVAALLGDSVPGDAASCEFPGGGAPYESWGPATAIVAAAGPGFWTSGGGRLIVPISDEGPCNGDLPDGCNDPGDDRDSVNNAIVVANNNNVVVSPIAGTSAGACAIDLMDALAAGTGGSSFLTKAPKFDLTDAVRRIVMDVCTINDLCDDGRPCTDNDVCRGGVCEGTPIAGCRLCVSAEDCDDANACTSSRCVDGACAFEPNYNTDTACCDPLDGTITLIDDANPCTEDLCNPRTGRVSHPPGPAGVLCDDGRVCTAMDECDGAGRCVGDDVAFFSCQSDQDCFGQVCDTEAGTCFCTEAPEVCLLPRPGGLPAAGCYEVGDEVVVDVVMSSTSSTITGGQFNIQYDPEILDFQSIVAGSASDPMSPFSVELHRSVDETDGTLFYAVGMQLGAVGTRGPAVLATVTFVPQVACRTEQLCFVDANPQQNRLVDDRGQGVPFNRCCSGEFAINGPPPALSCPEDVTISAEAGSSSAMVTWDPVSATSECDGAVDVVCTGESGSGMNIDPLAAAGGQLPAGDNVFYCVAQDGCGAESVCSWVVHVRDTNRVAMSVQLSSPMEPEPIERCIEFAFYSSCGLAPVVRSRTVTVGPPLDLPGKVGQVVVEVPAGDYMCVTARDPKHTLRSSSPLSIVDGEYVAEFVGDPAAGGNWLVAGNLDGNGVIDGVDAGVLSSQMLVSVPVDTPCGSPGFHADLNGDGIVDLTDQSILEEHYGAVDMPHCCSGTAATSDVEAGLSENGVQQLELMGFDVGAADTNADGVVDDRDVILLYERQRWIEADGRSSAPR